MPTGSRNRSPTLAKSGAPKFSVLDDKTSTQGGETNRNVNDVKEKIMESKGVRDMHFEMEFDEKLREKANMLESDDAKKH